MRNKIVVLTVLMLVFNSIVFASQLQEETGVMIKGLRPMGMGGAFTAISDDENVFFYNPAGITRRRDCLFQFLFIETAVSSKEFDYYNFFRNNKDDLYNFSNLSYADQDRLLVQVLKNINYIFISCPKISFIAEPIDIAENSLNFGFGIFSYTLFQNHKNLLYLNRYSSVTSNDILFPNLFQKTFRRQK
ncbi:MAG: hypothetical protein LBN01_04880, partial [Endomicrobium sp.]|nr:hypothetical protein [Endomicrobium sp.]